MRPAFGQVPVFSSLLFFPNSVALVFFCFFFCGRRSLPPCIMDVLQRRFYWLGLRGISEGFSGFFLIPFQSTVLMIDAEPLGAWIL